MTVTADLATLKRWLGTIGTADDDLLQICLDQALSWTADNVYDTDLAIDEVQGAIVDQSARWYQRRRSPEGVAGFSEFGAVRVMAVDPDIREKLALHLSMAKTCGIA